MGLANIFGHRDTVSSLGHIRSIDLPKIVGNEDHICIFRHALALDERRVKFLPEYRYNHGANIENSASSPSIPGSDRVKETWFRGSHSDM